MARLKAGRLNVRLNVRCEEAGDGIGEARGLAVYWDLGPP
jgi:hypothetical protein